MQLFLRSNNYYKENLGKQENMFLSGLIMRKRALTIIAYTVVGEWIWLNFIASFSVTNTEIDDHKTVIRLPHGSQEIVHTRK